MGHITNVRYLAGAKLLRCSYFFIQKIFVSEMLVRATLNGLVGGVVVRRPPVAHPRFRAKVNNCSHAILVVFRAGRSY